MSLQSSNLLLISSTVLFGTAGVLFFIYKVFMSKKEVKILLKDPNVKYDVQLIEKEELTHDTRRFRFSLPSNEHELGLPLAQHIYLSAIIDNKLVIRPYTPVSTEHVKGHFDLIVKVYFKNVHEKYPEGGKMSQYLNSLNIGDKINIRGPSGLLVYKNGGEFLIKKNNRSPAISYKYKKCGMIAGGSGITPMLQLAAAILNDPNDKTELWLLYANQSENDILCRNELEELAAKYPNQFHLWYTIDRSDENWKYSTGFVNSDMISEHLPPPDEQTIILMCGPPPMVNFACTPNLDKLGYNVKQRFAY